MCFWMRASGPFLFIVLFGFLLLVNVFSMGMAVFEGGEERRSMLTSSSLSYESAEAVSPS